MERSRKKVKFYFLFRLGSFLGYSVSESYSWLSLLSSVKSYFLDICSCWDSSRPSSGFGDETKQEQVCAFDSGLKSNNVWVVQKKSQTIFCYWGTTSFRQGRISISCFPCLLSSNFVFVFQNRRDHLGGYLMRSVKCQISSKWSVYVTIFNSF